MRDLGIPWVIRREMEVRSRRPSWYEGFAYEGLTAPVLALALPVAALIGRGAIGDDGLVWLTIPYALYLFYSAAGMAAGGMAVDRECLRRLPVSAWTLLAGKLVGSVLNLLLELAFASPLLLLLSLGATRSMACGGALLAFMAWLILYGGLLGVTWVRNDVSPRDVARRARANVSQLVVGMPLGIGALLVFGLVPRTSDLAGIWLLHPAGALLLLTTPPIHDRLLAGVVMCGVVAGLLVLRALQQLRSELP